MRKVILLVLMVFPSLVWANGFDLNIKKVDVVVNQAREVGVSEFAKQNVQISIPYANKEQSQYTVKNATTAFVLGIFLGNWGIHRLYLGTTVGVFIAYALTQAGCGTLYVVDNILLLMAMLDNSSIDRYIDNPGFFMWM